MSSCLRNIRAKNYSNLLILFKVTIENVRDVFGTQCIIQTPYDSRIQGHPSDPPSPSAVEQTPFRVIPVFSLASWKPFPS